MGAFRPVDSAVDQGLPPQLFWCFHWSRAHAGHASDLIPGLDRSSGRADTSLAVRGTSAPHGPRSARELERLGHIKRSPCSGLAPPTPTSDQATGVDVRGVGREDAGRRRSASRRQSQVWRRHPSGTHATATTPSTRTARLSMRRSQSTRVARGVATPYSNIRGASAPSERP